MPVEAYQGVRQRIDCPLLSHIIGVLRCLRAMPAHDHVAEFVDERSFEVVLRAAQQHHGSPFLGNPHREADGLLLVHDGVRRELNCDLPVVQAEFVGPVCSRFADLLYGQIRPP